ncbi:MAG: acyl carrier protein [Bauldia sp.]
MTGSTAELERIVAKAVSACSLPSLQAPSAPVNGSLLRFTGSFDEMGFDSLNYMEFCISIAVDTGVELSVAEVARLNSPTAVIEHLSRRAHDSRG